MSLIFIFYLWNSKVLNTMDCGGGLYRKTENS